MVKEIEAVNGLNVNLGKVNDGMKKNLLDEI